MGGGNGQLDRLLPADPAVTGRLEPPLPLDATAVLPARLPAHLARKLEEPAGDRSRQLAGLVAYLALAVTALSVGGELSWWLVAAGWLAHAGWDVVHHRRNAVVWRAYAEWCAVYDVGVAIGVVLLIVSS